MANGNTQVIREMKQIIDEGKQIDIKTRDRLLFTAVIDLYDHMEAIQPIIGFYKTFVFFASAIGIAVIGALVTGRIALVFR
jgi:hypothetical protein